jgi:WD40 repeat protein/transcriptional regulator with XRE-family HTH domain
MNAEPSFGQVVKPRRRELGLTQDELARRVGCAPVTIRKIEYDDLRPSVQIAERLAMALNIPLEERAAFVRLARIERHPEPAPTPAPAPEEIGIADLTGRAIRGYALGERIGAGGMGAVYRAVQPLVEREVAVKIILPQYANHPDFIRRFEAEAQLVARLEHPHIVPLYDFWREPSVAFLVMRLLRGGSVRNLLEKDVLPIEITLHIVEQVGSALAAAHRAGVIHRDLKPANILLDEDHNAYLADFGIAKNLSNPNLEDQTQMEAVIGSPDYISPEQIRSEFVRPQTDIYCLGVVLYELLTGHVPFAGPTPIEIMHQHLSAPLPPLAARRTGLPGALDAIIERATAKDPLERYPDVEEMLDDLRRAVRGDVLVVRPLTAIVERPPLTAADNPYKGLRAFAESDAGDFFGRESLVQQLLVRMGEGGDLSHFLAVVGPSGSGKSSVVGAGLLPTLRRGALPGSDHWFIVEMMPGAHPLEELEAALLRIAVNPPETLLNQLREDKRGLLRAVRRCLPDDPAVELVLVIDQFEEVFTLVRDESVRAHLLDSLVTAVLDERSRIRVVITLRADFTDRPLQYVDFGELMRQRLEVVLPMTPDELERAILGPGERVGLTLESSLTSTIIRDVGDQPGALPLLQYALTELFEKREGRMLTKSAYQSIGGVLSALGRRAEEVFASLDEAGQSAARQLFLRLVTLGEGVEDTRRRVLRSEIESISNLQSPISKVIDSFGKHRLLTFDRDPLTRGPTVEVAHEALLREWPHLREWLNESRADVRLQRQLANATAEWQSANRDSSFLLTGTRLVQFEGWAANTTVALTSGEQAYLVAGVAERDRREVEERERQGRELEAARKLAETEREAATRLRARNRVIAVAGGIALVLAALAGLFGLQSNQNADRAEQNLGAAQIANTQSAASVATAQAAGLLADEQRDVALNAEATAQAERDRADEAALLSFSRELAVRAKLNLTVDPERSILLALAALDQAYTQEAENVLHEAVLASRLRLTLRGHEDSIEELTYSPNGKLIATASLDNTARLWDATTGKELLRLQHSAGVGHVAFTPDGSRLATGTGDGLVRLWDVASGDELLTIPAAPKATRDIFLAQFMDFSPDGRLLATTADYASEVKFWDPASGDELFTLSDPAWLTVAPGVDLNANRIKFSPDGTRLAISLGSGDVGLGRIEVWDVVTRQKVQTLAGDFRFDPFLPMSFSPDGTRLAATRGPGDRTAIWDVASGNLLFSLTESSGGNDILYSADGKRLLNAGSGGRVIVFDAETGDQLLVLVGHTGLILKVSERPGCVQPPAAPFEWCGTHLASASGDGTVRVWDISPTGSQELLTLPGSQFALNPDGTRLTTVLNPPYDPVAGVTLPIQVWDLPAGPRSVDASSYTSSFIEIDAGYQWTFLNSTGVQVAAFDNGPFKFWDVLVGGKALYPISCCSWEDGLSFSISDRREPRAAIGDWRTGRVRIWDLSADEQIRTVQVAEPNDLARVYLSPDGERLATVNFDTSVETWDVTTGQKLLTLPGPASADLRFSPDGKWLAIADCTGTVVVRDAASGEEKLRFSSTSACINAVGFSPDGKLFAVNAGNRGLKILDFETGQELLTLPGGFDVEFTPDGTRVISAIIDEQGKQVVRMYLLRLEDIVALAKTRVTRSLTTEECQRYLHVEVCPEP